MRYTFRGYVVLVLVLVLRPAALQCVCSMFNGYPTYHDAHAHAHAGFVPGDTGRVRMEYILHTTYYTCHSTQDTVTGIHRRTAKGKFDLRSPPRSGGSALELSTISIPGVQLCLDDGRRTRPSLCDPRLQVVALGCAMCVRAQGSWDTTTAPARGGLGS